MELKELASQISKEAGQKTDAGLVKEAQSVLQQDIRRKQVEADLMKKASMGEIHNDIQTFLTLRDKALNGGEKVAQEVKELRQLPEIGKLSGAAPTDSSEASAGFEATVSGLVDKYIQGGYKS